METKYDVIALGELLIDFNQAALNDNGNYLYEAAAGGAPCNVLSMLQKLGRKTAFIGKVGKDSFGEYLKETIEDIGINTDNLLMTSAANTSLAFVSRNAYGDRCFQFYRDPGADMLLRKDEVIAANIAKSKIFHFGTLSFTSTDTKEATCYAVECAEEAGKLISFDPNIRINLWNDPQEARKAMDYGLKKCDILKISDEELFFLTGIRDQDEAMKILKATYEIPFICLTMGRNGSCAYYHDRKIQMGAFLQEKTVDTTGAGDSFMGALLFQATRKGFSIDQLSVDELKSIAGFADACSAGSTRKYGSMDVMTTMEDARWIMENIPLKQPTYDF